MSQPVSMVNPGGSGGNLDVRSDWLSFVSDLTLQKNKEVRVSYPPAEADALVITISRVPRPVAYVKLRRLTITANDVFSVVTMFSEHASHSEYGHRSMINLVEFTRRMSLRKLVGTP